MSKKDCNSCAHSVVYRVRIGDTAYGNYADDWDCEVMDKLTDDDVEQCNNGNCPYYEAI